MKNYIRPGNSVPVAAPAGGLASGAGYLAGALFGVASTTAAEGETVEIAVVGVFDLPKTSAQAWTVGVKVYWSGTECTTTASGNTLIGVAFAAAANPSAVGRVRLNGYVA